MAEKILTIDELKAACRLPKNSTMLEMLLYRCIDRIEERINEEISNAEISCKISELWNYEKCPARFLPYLAWSLGVEYWDDSWGDDEASDKIKRNYIKQWIGVRKIRGTLGAIKKAMELIGVNCTIEEWFNHPNGFTDEPNAKPEPYSFRVMLYPKESGQVLSYEKTKIMKEFIDRLKPLRSFYSVHIEFKTPQPIGIVSVATIKSIVRMERL
jgi:phage tail P2-like protein